MSILEEIGASQEGFEKATGEVAKEYTPLAAGVYKGKVKEVLVYTNKFGGKQMRYIVTVDNDGEPRDVTFKSDIGSHLKDKSENGGYANRLKQFCYATNTDVANLTKKENATKLNTYGQEYSADAILGMNDRPVLAEVLLMSDTTKAEGEQYKYSNALSGVLAPDGTDASGENKSDAFVERCKKTPVTEYKGYEKKASAPQAQASGSDKASVEAAGF